jgi:entericidin B
MSPTVFFQIIFSREVLIMIRKILTPLLAAIFLAGTIGVTTGCNTVEGAGKDIQQGGKAIKDEANEQKH